MPVTTATAWNPELWTPGVLRALERRLVMASRVKRFNVNTIGKGDILHYPEIANLTASAVTNASGAYTLSTPTENDNSISLNRWFAAAIETVDLDSIQSNYDVEAEYKEKIGFALGLQVETDLLALESSISQTVGVAGADLGIDQILNAVQLLDEADTPEEDRYCAVSSAQKRALLRLDQFTDASKRGTNKPGSLVKGGFSEDTYGVEFLLARTVASRLNSVRNLMFHRDSLVLAMQVEPKMVMKDPTSTLSKMIVGHSNWGRIVPTNRASAAVTLIS